MKRTVFAAVALPLMLTACAAPGGKQESMGELTPLLTIPDAMCAAERIRCIDILITGTGSSAVIEDPGDTSFQGVNHVIFWRLPGSYTFAPDGIKISDASGPSNEFTCRRVLLARVWFCINRHTVGSSSDEKRYKYTIKVNGITNPRDPHVVNN